MFKSIMRGVRFLWAHRYGIGFVLFLLVAAYVVHEQGQQNDRTEDLVIDDLHEDIDDEYDTCQARADVRRTLYSILDEVVAGTITPRTALNLINIAGFESLDPAMQYYLENLEDSLNAPDTEPSHLARVRDEFKEDNPIPNCEAERAAAEAELEKELTDGS